MFYLFNSGPLGWTIVVNIGHKPQSSFHCGKTYFGGLFDRKKSPF
jgi:hypothetical protein